VVGTFREPGNIGPALAVPLILFAVTSGGLGDITKIKGFPTSSITTWSLTIPFALGSMMLLGTTGTSIATDIEHGFINRLALTPLRSVAVVLAQLVGVLGLGLLQAAVFLGVGFASGAHVEAGVTGTIVLVALFLTGVAGFGALGLLVGLWTGSPAAVAGIAPMAAVFLFLSSMAFPRNLIETDWFRKLATVNPLSYYVEGLRSLIVLGWDKQALAFGFAFTGGLLVVSIVASTWMLKRRLAGT
jgi:ABC-2 type transport system permease protein